VGAVLLFGKRPAARDTACHRRRMGKNSRFVAQWAVYGCTSLGSELEYISSTTVQSSLRGVPLQNCETAAKMLPSSAFSPPPPLAGSPQKLTGGVLCFGHPIGHQNEPVAGIELAASALKDGIAQQPHRNIAMRRTNLLPRRTPATAAHVRNSHTPGRIAPQPTSSIVAYFSPTSFSVRKRLTA